MNRLGKIVTSVVLCASLVVAPLSAAPKSKEIKKEKEAAQKQAAQLEQKKNSVAGQVTKLEQDLSKMILKITNLEDDISNKQAEVDELTMEYNEAQADEKKQYQDMKIRIKYMYEEGDSSFVNKIVASQSITDLLNQVDYVQSVHSYDRKKLNEYVETKEAVAELKTSVEDEVKTLQTKEKECKVAQKELQSTIEVKQAEVENFAEQLANAQALAAQKAEEQKQAEREEAAAAAAEAEAKAKAEAEAAQKAAQEQAEKEETKKEENKTNSSSSSNNKTNVSSSSSSSSSSSESNSSSSNTGSSSSSQSSSSSKEEPTASSANASKGQAIANYACQFIGNPYVWGGTSLTKGTDCSGFTMSVMAHFGYSIPHSSYAQRSVGKKVSSLANALPGDIICFNGHVGLYCGGGMMVHASNPTYGIVKTSVGWSGKAVVAIRRVF